MLSLALSHLKRSEVLYRTILADPPWQMPLRTGGSRRRPDGSKANLCKTLPYPTMTIEAISSLPVAKFSTDDAHLWLWTTNSHIEAGFSVMRCWGFKYLAPIHWIKPNGVGNWFSHRSQTALFGYRKFCRFPLARYRSNVFHTKTNVKKHSQKPSEAFDLIESISPGPRLELFARSERVGWACWGNEVPSIRFASQASDKVNE
jgi:N6-adenosine-specific RNA methylase IME4